MEFRLRPLGFIVFLQNNNEMNRKWKKYSQKTVGTLSESLRVIVSVWVCVGVCVGESEGTNTARWFNRI